MWTSPHTTLHTGKWNFYFFPRTSEREREKCALKRNTIAQRRGDSGASGAKDIKQQNETPLLLTLSYN